MSKQARVNKIWFVLMVSLVCVVSAISILSRENKNELHAEGFSTAPTFGLYEKVKLADKEFTVVQTGTTLKLLADTASSNAMTWNDAKDSLTSYQTTFGTLGNTMVSGKASLPLTSDLSAVTSGTSLHASLPKLSTDWWLGDVDLASTNRSKFVDENNTLNKAMEITKTVFTNGACSTSKGTENGLKPTITKKDADIIGTKLVNGDYTIRYNLKASGGSYIAFRAYTGANCTGSDNTLSPSINENKDIKVNIKNSVPEAWDLSLAFFANELEKDSSLGLNVGTKVTVPIVRSQCVNFKKKLNLLWNGLKGSYASIQSLDGTPINITYTVLANSGSEKVTCPGQAQIAGTSATRPLISLPQASIAFANTEKREYKVGKHLSLDFPTSDDGVDKPYLTLLSPPLKVGLTAGADGVSGNTYTTSMPDNHIVSIPVTLQGNSEGTKYVSASATIKGVKMYGVLKQMDGTSGTIELDMSDFTDDFSALSSQTITLYQENSGDFHTAYIGEGTDITLNFATPQTIQFDAGQANTVAYGSSMNLHASLTSPLDEQSNDNIEYTLVSGNATITNTTYDKATGKASAVITPTSGTGEVIIAINKAGNSLIGAAKQQTFTITLSKKQISLHPVKPDRIYSIGEDMMKIASASEDLVDGDTIPVSLIPKLINMDGSTTLPDQDGKVTALGKWKMIYESTVLDSLTSFTDKYDVTLLDYDDDTQCVFETGIADIPSGWILVTPDANSAGWNKEAVTIKPSAEAIAAGYTSIEEVNDDGDVLKQGAMLVYSTSIDPVTPKVRLKKETTVSEVSTIREIKIDLTAPTGTISVENESTWIKGTKKVVITPSDTYSGIDTITVTNENGNNYTPVKSGSTYSFDADENAIYTIKLKDKAGNEKELIQKVEQIESKDITLEAVPEDLTLVEPTKDINVTWSAGDSGVKTFVLYYKETAQDTYEKLEDLNFENTTFTYIAEMNGIFKFELVNYANQSKAVEVTITNVNPPVPVTRITAVYNDDNSKSYTSGTWTNHDIQLSLTNVNTEIADTVSWMMSENGTDWEEFYPTTKSITTNDVLHKTYHFKAYITKNGTKIEETNAKKMTIKIDKTKPAAPIIKDKENYGPDKWFKEDVKIEAVLTPKAHNADIQQDIYLCAGTEEECKNASAAWIKTMDGTKLVSGNGSYEYYFKTMDEAGNESELSDPVLVNINDRSPLITIQLNTNPIKDLIDNLTFGFFFNDKVDITFSADFDDGDIYYILDSSDQPTTPEDDDHRWKKGTSTSLSPDAKAMIYVKAVSKAGVIGRESSVYNVYADCTPPIIELSENATSWSKEIMMEAGIRDGMSGVKADSIRYAIDGGSDTRTTLTNGKITISNLKDGSYPVSVKASDNAGNSAAAHTIVWIDHTNPIIDTPIADSLEYAKEHTITFHTSDPLSGLANGYPKVDGDSITANADGSYSFKTDTNKSYRIDTMDKAGNAHMISYVENKIDTIAPVISNKLIENEADFKTKKKVSFDAVDNESGIDTVVVTYIKDGQSLSVNVQLPSTGDTYSFTAIDNADYTITVTDKAGNSKTDTIKVENIDPDGIKIKNISDTSTWVKDEMRVSFEVQVGSSGIKAGFPTVVSPEQADIIVTKTGDTYFFTASENSTYTITARNEAEDEVEEIVRIQRIDKQSPVIYDISKNTTSTTWRGPQDITFHVKDDNDSTRTTNGSGMKSGYPKVSYMENGIQTYVSVIQDTNDFTLYTFKAEKNTIYTIEAMDQVEHPVVKESISVDHILDDSMFSDIIVEAKNDDKLISSGTWVKGSVLFTISGGLQDSVRTKYQVAVSDGTMPNENDWQDLNMAATNQHKVTGNEKDKSYYFRVLPDLEGTKITAPFIVNLDNTAPTNTEIIITKKNANPIARFINALTFGGWMKEAQSVSFKATDNFTDEVNLRYEYMEEIDGVKGQWMQAPKNLSYENSDIVIYARAIDLAGNESTDNAHESLQIDILPPVIEGVKDQKEYKQYYLPRTIRVSDPAGGSGLKSAVYIQDNGSAVVFDETVKIKNTSKQPEVYTIQAEDKAGNMTELTFKLIPLPSMDDITGSDEDKKIIDQIQKELDEQRDDLGSDEIDDYEKWINDATDKWKGERTNKLEDTDTGSFIEGKGDTTFDPNTQLIVDKIKESDIPILPRKAIHVFDVYMKKGNTIIQPDGSVKVYLPYTEKEAPIVYEIDEDGTVREIKVSVENGYVTFVTDKLKKYAISNTAQVENNQCPNDGVDINIDTNKDGMPDVNIDTDGDCKADLNIDVDGDKIPDIDIDTNLDGKPDYNVDTNHDGKADLNIGPKPDPWIPEHCNKIYCTDNTLIPEVNIDTDGDGKPDINMDVDGDGNPDLNIDIDKDGEPDVNIDTDGDGKADTNIDEDGDGKIDTVNDPNKDDQTTNPTTNTKGPNTNSVQGSYHQAAIGGALTQDTTSMELYTGIFLMSIMVLYIVRRLMKAEAS